MAQKSPGEVREALWDVANDFNHTILPILQRAESLFQMIELSLEKGDELPERIMFAARSLDEAISGEHRPGLAERGYEEAKP